MVDIFQFSVITQSHDKGKRLEGQINKLSLVSKGIQVQADVAVVPGWVRNKRNAQRTVYGLGFELHLVRVFFTYVVTISFCLDFLARFSVEGYISLYPDFSCMTIIIQKSVSFSIFAEYSLFSYFFLSLFFFLLLLSILLHSYNINRRLCQCRRSLTVSQFVADGLI